ncbi:MAG: alpha/beta hydrolase-fold protein [Planctomycetaceae bacterium]
MSETWAPSSENGKRALAILDEVEKNYSIDRSREYLTGWSMGGYGSWRVAAAFPERFAAVVPVSGAGDPVTGPKLAKTRIWAFHGARDDVVPVWGSHEMIDSIREAGGTPRYTEYSDVGHDVWRYVYNNDALYQWLLDPRAPVPADGMVTAGTNGGTLPLEVVEPFRPAVDIPRAVYVRLGNDMFASLSRSVPFVVPADMLTGRVDDIHDSTSAAGRTFQVSLTGITYSGRISRAQVKAYKKDRLNIQLGLRNVVLQICASEVEGRWRTVCTGPMAVVIGHRRPVWLSIDVTPYVEQRQLKLRLAGVAFSIPDDNWYVTEPSDVYNAGLIMSARRVSDGLVNGIYSKKQMIEQQVTDLIPALLPQLQDQLRISEINDVVSGFWPLPVYKPRVKAWPEAVETDENGISLLMGVTAAAIDPNKAPAQPRVVPPLGPELATFPRTDKLELGVAPNLLNPLTEMLVEAEVARIHVLDIPEKTFAVFVDRDALAAAIPDLNNFSSEAQLSSEMVMLAPLSVVDGPPGGAGGVVFKAPRVGIRISVKRDPNAAWQRYADLEFDISQPAKVQLSKPAFEERAVGIDWSGKPEIQATAKFAEGYQPRNGAVVVEKIRELFTESWTAWTSTSHASHTSVPDVDFGYAKQRLDHAEWAAPYLFATFDKPGIELSNTTDIPFEYELKGAYSEWGGPYTISPKGTVVFDVDMPILFRYRHQGRVEIFTLPVGSHSEFRVPSRGGDPRLLKGRRRAS